MEQSENATESGLVEGALAPDFTLPEVRGPIVSMSDSLENSRVVLVFYRGGWCPLCNIQLRRLSEHYAGFEERNHKLLAISNEEVQVRDKIDAPYPLLFDRDSIVLAKYGLVVGKRDPLGWMLRKNDYAYPTVFLVGQDGLIRWIYRGQNYRDRPSPAAILEAADNDPVVRRLDLGDGISD